MLPKQIGFVCVCITVLLFIMLVVQKHWYNSNFNIIRLQIYKLDCPGS